MTTDSIIAQYFDIRPMGVSVCDGIKPPPDAFDALLLSLAGDIDNLRWQTAAACNLYERYHRKQAHLIAASRFDCSPETIAAWCYIERKVPYNARVEGLSIWFHKLVATVSDSALQREYLETCLKHSWSESAFEQWLRDKRQVDIPESHWQTDRQFEQSQQIYNLANENADLKKQVDELIKESETSQVSHPVNPANPTEANELSRPVADWLKQVGYSSMIIYANGRIVIKP